jgi:hypothetical protein
LDDGYVLAKIGGYGIAHTGKAIGFGFPEGQDLMICGEIGLMEDNSNRLGLKCNYGIQIRSTLYNSSGVIVDLSDRNAKNSIDGLSSSYSLLFDNLRPVVYRYNNGTSGRLHTGFIAQEVYEAMENAGLSSEEFACVCVDDKGEWGVRYSEIIPLNTYEIQKLKKEVAELKAKIGG